MGLAVGASLGLAAALSVAFGGEGSAPVAPQGHVDFVKDVQPILKTSCIECHNAKKHKANLRLDNREDAFKGGDGGKSIVPGHIKDSLLIAQACRLVPQRRGSVRCGPAGEGRASPCA